MVKQRQARREEAVLLLLLACSAAAAAAAAAASERIDILDVARAEEAPWSVLVLCGNNRMFCSGALLHESWVLTAAHCLYDEDGLFTEDDGSVTVVAGADRLHYSKEDVESERVQIRRSARLVVHGDYSYAENLVNDLALIRLERPVALGRRAAAARLADRPRAHAHAHAHADEPFVCECLGFGKIMRYADHRNDFSLKRQPFEVSERCRCLERLRSSRRPYAAALGRFVCDEHASWAGLCPGDNGAQLVCDGALRAIGTAVLHYDIAARCLPSEWRLECGDRRTMSVFTDLCPYKRWIGEHVPADDDNCGEQ